MTRGSGFVGVYVPAAAQKVIRTKNAIESCLKKNASHDRKWSHDATSMHMYIWPVHEEIRRGIRRSS
jgi:hypothetical protein